MSAEQGFIESPAPQVAETSDGGESFGGSGGFELDENGQRVPHGMGQSKSSRRRRRKRKGKGPETAGAQPGAEGGAEQSEDGGESAVAQIQASAGQPSTSIASQQPRQQNGQGRGFQGGQPGSFQANGSQQSNGGQPQNGAPGGTKRWKKKFRDRERPRFQENPGNQANGSASASGGGFGGAAQSNGNGFRSAETHQPGNGGSFKRKGGFGGGGKQQRSGGGASRGFVGPMDHSYRAVNGNIFDTPPSTMEPYGNGGGRGRSYQSDSQPIDYSMGRPVPIAPDAPTKIYFFIDDLFITAKINETARKLGVKVAFVKNDKEEIAALTSHEDDDRPGLIVFDLNNANVKPLTLIPKLKAKLKKTASIIGFLSHLQGDLKAKAVEAGCDTVMPRAAFSQNLPNLLRRYGIEDAEEPNYNQ